MKIYAVRIGLAAMILTFVGIGRADDNSGSTASGEKDLLGVWVLHGEQNQILRIQIFGEDHWFAGLSMETPGFEEFGLDAGVQTGKWSIAGDRLKLDYEVGDHHTNPKFKVNSGSPPQLVIHPNGDGPDGGYVWSKLEAPMPVSEQAVVGSWIYGWNQAAAPFAWNLDKDNTFNVRIADEPDANEHGPWHLSGNKIALGVTESSTPEDVGFSGGGDIVMLSPNWLIIDEQLSESRHKLDIFHRAVSLKTGLPGQTSNIPNAGEARVPLDAAAAEAKAKADLSSLSAALDLFDVDNGRYPTEVEGFSALTLRPANLPAWHSYIEHLPSDPWGHPYVYHTPGKNGQPYEIISCGPDGKEGTADDVKE